MILANEYHGNLMYLFNGSLCTFKGLKESTL